MTREIPKSHLSRTLHAFHKRDISNNFRGPSTVLLCYEYLRRLALWTTTADVFRMWWHTYTITWYRAEIGLALMPRLALTDALEEEIDALKGYEDFHDICRDAVYWALARDHFDFSAHYHLPDPYEPFLLMTQRGGTMSIFDLGFENLLIYSGEEIFREHPGYEMVKWFTSKTIRKTPYIELDEDVLDAIDDSLRVGLDYINHDDAAYNDL